MKIVLRTRGALPLRSTSHAWTVTPPPLRVQETKAVPGEPQWPWAVIWKKETGLSFEKTVCYMLSVVEILWHVAAD